MQIDEYVTRLLQHAGIKSAQVSLTDSAEEERIYVQIDLDESESGALIGHHGETLSAIQRITNIVFREELDGKRVSVNINDYRDRRTDALVAQTIRAAERVLETGETYTFTYLPSNERFLVHSTLSDDDRFAELESVSEGEGKNRLLTIQFKKPSNE